VSWGPSLHATRLAQAAMQSMPSLANTSTSSDTNPAHQPRKTACVARRRSHSAYKFSSQFFDFSVNDFVATLPTQVEPSWRAQLPKLNLQCGWRERWRELRNAKVLALPMAADLSMTSQSPGSIFTGTWPSSAFTMLAGGIARRLSGGSSPMNEQPGCRSEHQSEQRVQSRLCHPQNSLRLFLHYY
jgi:hypothetical protein